MTLRPTPLAAKTLITSALVMSCACGQDGDGQAPSAEVPQEVLSGGETTVFDTTRSAYTFSARNLSALRKKRFFVGNSLFNENWVEAPASTTARDGLGPLFNALSCSSCHFKDGRGPSYDEDGQPATALLFRLSAPDERGLDAPVPGYGGQLNPRAVPGIEPEAKVTISWQMTQGAFEDGTPYTLKQPRPTFEALAYGPMPETLRVSGRTAPPVYGLGLLELIPDQRLLELADAQDQDGDGISGRPNYVMDVVTGALTLGRFGWKANQPSLLQQNAGAFVGDMGITSPLFPNEGCQPEQTLCAQQPTGADDEGVEISAARLADVTFYTKTLAVPARRDWDDPVARRGQALFEQLNCSGCHVPKHVTGDDPEHPELSSQTIYPYTDLLLHDMGEGLADGRPDGQADGQEWRTPPLWGIGLLKRVNGHLQLMHDGRADGFEEAILWHGGEAEASAVGYKKLSRDEREALIRFLESL